MLKLTQKEFTLAVVVKKEKSHLHVGEKRRKEIKERFRAILATPNQPQILEFHSLHMKQNRNKASHPISHSRMNLSLYISRTASGSGKRHGGTNLHCHCIHMEFLLCNHDPRETIQPGCAQHTRPPAGLH